MRQSDVMQKFAKLELISNHSCDYRAKYGKIEYTHVKNNYFYFWCYGFTAKEYKL